MAKAAETISDFRGKYRFLSNFYMRPVWYEGICYPSAEHAFQAAKTTSKKKRRAIADLPEAKDAKYAGRSLKLRKHWELIKVGVMMDILRAKFSDPMLRKKLLGTGDANLIEGNYWHDLFWGRCDCAKHNAEGLNLLGHCLMRVRDEIRLELSQQEEE